MADQKKKPAAAAAASMAPPSRRSRRPPNVQMVQNFQLIWLDGNIDETNNEDCRNFITKLRQVVNTVNTFTDADECIDFISDIKEEKAFMISSGAFGKTTVPIVHDNPQVSTIYIFCGNKARHEQWVKQWPKIKGVFTDITLICEALKQATQDYDQNSVSISFANTTDGLNSSFMYTQILKEILLTIDFEAVHFKEFLTYCREQLVGNIIELKNVDLLDKDYRNHLPVWWYTYESFLYSMLNRALRTMEVELIIKMGFFVRDLHEHLVALHKEQFEEHGHSASFTVYRGQGLSQTDFDQMQKTQGGLLSFNNFLSTSKNRDVSCDFARRTAATSNLVGILYVMQIDPSIPSTPFANIRNVSCFEGEEEILFSMHSVFHIGQIQQIDGNNRLWQVDLLLTSDNDPDLCALTERMREESFPELKGWQRLGNLLIDLGQFSKAQQVCEVLLDQVSDEREEASIYHLLGLVKDNQGEYAEAIIFYEKAITIEEKILSPTDQHVATSYNNIGVVYSKMGNYSKALSSHEKALEIRQKTLPANHPDFSQSYNNIGGVYFKMGDYSKSLSSYEKALEIAQKSLPPNHPSLGTSYNNIGLVYKKMGDYPKALSYYEKDQEILKKSLPPNHPDLGSSYNNIGTVHLELGDYSQALSSHEKALEIRQKSLPANHPGFAQSYNNIGLVYSKMGDYSKALSSYDKALEILKQSLPPNHPDLATSYNSIAGVHLEMGDYSKALPFCERAVDIGQHSLPADHPNLQLWKENLETVKKKL